MTPEQAAMWPNGREDELGNVWFACDPFPHWFRRENGQIIERGYYDPYWREDVEAKGGLKLVDGHAHYRVWDDKCARSGGLGCGYSEAKHPLDSGTGKHDFVPGWRWVRDDHPMLELKKM